MLNRNKEALYMDAKHTPGPWKKGGGGSSVTAHIGFSTHPVCEISAAAPSRGSIYRIELHRDELIANADLIAVAPDLLSDLIDAAEIAHCGCGQPACSQCARDKRWSETICKALGHSKRA